MHLGGSRVFWGVSGTGRPVDSLFPDHRWPWLWSGCVIRWAGSRLPDMACPSRVEAPGSRVGECPSAKLTPSAPLTLEGRGITMQADYSQGHAAGGRAALMPEERVVLESSGDVLHTRVGNPANKHDRRCRRRRNSGVCVAHPAIHERPVRTRTSRPALPGPATSHRRGRGYSNQSDYEHSLHRFLADGGAASTSVDAYRSVG